MINIEYTKIVKEITTYVSRFNLNTELSELAYTLLYADNHNSSILLKDILNKAGNYELAYKMDNYVLYLGNLLISPNGRHKLTTHFGWLKEIYKFNEKGDLDVHMEFGDPKECALAWNDLTLKIKNLKKLSDAI